MPDTNRQSQQTEQTSKTPKTQQPQQTNEGEGSRSAAHNYDEGVEQYVKSGRVEKAAEEAKRAVDGAEGEELRRAEEKGKRSQHS